MNTVDYDAVVVGAGAGGIYAVHKLTQEGLRVIAFEGAPEVGGVWYHNRYPGARVDIESYFYCFPDEDLYHSGLGRSAIRLSPRFWPT